MNIDLNNTYWERLRGFITELRVDTRWVLRNKNNDKPYGSLRIASFPDLPPGYLRAIFTYVTTIANKTNNEKIQATEDYQMDVTELEVYSVDENIKTEQKSYEAPFSELEEMFDIKIFD